MKLAGFQSLHMQLRDASGSESALRKGVVLLSGENLFEKLLLLSFGLLGGISRIYSFVLGMKLCISQPKRSLPLRRALFYWKASLELGLVESIFFNHELSNI